MKRPKIGDIIEIPTVRGLAYAQFMHKHPIYGALLRVIEGFHSLRPAVQSVAQLPTQFVAFFPLGAAVSRRIFEIVGNEPVPLESREFPIFRSGTPDPNTKRVQTWWLWDGTNDWRVSELSPEQRKYPILGTWNDTLLIERIVQQWRHEDTDW
jgi:hypothetical protein